MIYKISMPKLFCFPIGDEIFGKENGPDAPDISGGERRSVLSAMTVKELKVVVSGSVEGTTTHIPPSQTLVALPTKKPRKPRTPKTSASADGKSAVHLILYDM